MLTLWSYSCRHDDLWCVIRCNWVISDRHWIIIDGDWVTHAQPPLHYAKWHRNWCESWNLHCNSRNKMHWWELQLCRTSVNIPSLHSKQDDDGLDKTQTLDLTPLDLEASTLLSNLLITLFNSVKWGNEVTNKHMKMRIYLYMHTN